MILLTAQPRTGKSTAIKKIVNMLGTNNCGGFYTEEIRENNERVGFKINALNGATTLLAHINITSQYKISRYGVDLDAFEKLCIPQLESALLDNNIKYIIIDEIGPMQLFSEKYKMLLTQLLKSDKIIIGTIFMDSYDWLDDFKRNEGIHLIEITLENRDDLPLQIVQTLTKNCPNLRGKIEKAKRYSNEIDRFTLMDNIITINSEHGIRTIKIEHDEYTCDCEFFQENGTCSHIIAAVNLNLYQKNNGQDILNNNYKQI